MNDAPPRICSAIRSALAITSALFSGVALRKISPTRYSSLPCASLSRSIMPSTSSSPTLTKGSTRRRRRRLHANSPLICCLSAVSDDPLAFRNRSEEHTSELQSLMRISYAVFCLKKKNQQTRKNINQEETQQQDTDRVPANINSTRLKP